MEAPRLTIQRAKKLRGHMSLPEVLVWRAIRGRKLGGYRFRRQHPIGPYILDFFCDEAKLSVEIDGRTHDDPERQANDRRRTDWLAKQGIAVLRISADDVLKEFDGVMELIGLRVSARVAPSVALRAPPPPAGED